MPGTIRLHEAASITEDIEALDRQIRERAWELSRRANRRSDGPAADWLEAERDVMWRPAVELKQEGRAFVLTAAIAGVAPEQVDLTLTPTDLLLRADLEHHHAAGDGSVHVCEFHRGRLFRAIRFPSPIQPARARASMKNGLLTVTVPMQDDGKAAAPAARRPRKR
ncbi:MAG: Hsp20/alpha crystallin family protein [Acidobacteriota bacterium]|nr:Hsp20/alpha crystallin family protein [Acidobacteriota bacterium]